MDQTHVNGSATLQQRLEDPATAEALNRLLDRVDAVDRALAAASTLAGQAPGLLAMLADTMDDVAAEAADNGIDVDSRLRGILVLAEKLTAPRTVAVLSALMDRIDRLEQLVALADSLPGLLAMFVDVADELAAQAAASGVDIDETISRSGHALKKLNDLVSSGALEALLDSGLFDPHAVGIVGMMGASMVKCQEECMSLPEPRRYGLLGALWAMRDPDVQRALAFIVNLGRFFGQGIQTHHHAAHQSTSQR